jgi:methylamine dehydrogenase heavy chain
MGGQDGSVRVVELEGKTFKVVGAVPLNGRATFTLSSDGSKALVSETVYTRGNRGDRVDTIAIYDGLTLNLEKEIAIPGMLQVVPKSQIFDLSSDDKLAYVYDMFPASQVYAVDLAAGQVISTVDLPGCALAFPYGPRSFATICGDGTLGVATIPAAGGAAEAVFSKPFFNPDEDPLFEQSVVDDATGDGYFLSFTGKIYPAKLGATPVLDKPWSVTGAAGLPEVGPGVQELAWRPGGGQMLALHRASKRLFVLMHAGNHWTPKEAGSEVWVLDAATRTLVKRIKLEKDASNLVVSQDAAPVLYVYGGGSDLVAYDALTGGKITSRPGLSGGLGWTITR